LGAGGAPQVPALTIPWLITQEEQMAIVAATNRLGATLTTPAIEQFGHSLRGRLLRPGEAGYDAARTVWNAMIDKRPAMIARCAGVADVVRSVNFAREHGLLVSVRGGGHNVAGNAVCDGGLMIDLAPMTGIRVDVGRRTARAEGGCTWRDLDHEGAAFGLATTGGIIPSTGIAGLTLGGGLGWLMRKHGLSCDNLQSADVVLASGEVLTASGSENADLFWGLRGGGGNFGVVTAFEYRLHPVDQVLGGMVVHSLERAPQALGFLREFAKTAPDELVCMAVLLTAPDGAQVLAIVVCYCGPLADGERVLRPLRQFGPPAADQIAAMPYVALQGLLEAGFPPGRQNYWKSNFLRELSDDAIGAAVEAFRGVPSPTSAIAFEQLGGAMSRVGAADTAFGHRDAPFNFLVVSSWTDATENARQIDWTRSVWRALQPFSAGGVYVNYLADEADEGGERIKAAYSAAKYQQLAALKRKYDPANLFRVNQNIRPSA
jgi:FAD/FMN-containing dehydrogenase